MVRRVFPHISVLALLLLVASIAVSTVSAQSEEAVTCPGSAVSRLIVGGTGQVLPGPANRLRSEASIAGAEIGSIPGGGRFIVIEGPVCADEYAWWQVAYDGLIGWTAEGSGEEYWLRPEVVLTGQQKNADWTPVTQDFDGVEMALVPAGCFLMGSDDELYQAPLHQICFDDAFWIDRYEVTNAQFARLGGEAERDGNSTDDDRPREMINWFEARDFCQLRGGRLPSEAEWEYAARGPDGLLYPWGDDFEGRNVVWWGNADGQSAAVGSRTSGMSWVGAFDMSGNVEEWTGSIYRDYPYIPDDGREDDTDTSSARVFRGGSFDYADPNRFQTFTRDRGIPNLRGHKFGFRCARSASPDTESVEVGFLTVDIDYDDSFYREVFDYTRQAENIRHYVLVVPESEVGQVNPAGVFTSIAFPTEAGELSVQEGREANAPAFVYLHEAPEGYFTGEFEPGRYSVAVAFIAAALSREEAGVGDDVILYAGVTGGGASTDFRDVVIEPGQTHEMTFRLTDNEGWACPWLYLYDGQRFQRTTEILRNLRGKQNDRTEMTRIDGVEVVDGTITFRIAEEKEEIAFVDELYIMIDGVKMFAEGEADATSKVADKDQDYLILRQGEAIEFSFSLPESFSPGAQASILVVASGFYETLE